MPSQIFALICLPRRWYGGLPSSHACMAAHSPRHLSSIPPTVPKSHGPICVPHEMVAGAIKPLLYMLALTRVATKWGESAWTCLHRGYRGGALDRRCVHMALAVRIIRRVVAARHVTRRDPVPLALTGDLTVPSRSPALKSLHGGHTRWKAINQRPAPALPHLILCPAPVIRSLGGLRPLRVVQPARPRNRARGRRPRPLRLGLVLKIFRGQVVLGERVVCLPQIVQVHAVRVAARLVF